MGGVGPCFAGRDRKGVVGGLRLGQAQYRLLALGDCEPGMNRGWVERDWAREGGGRALQQKGSGGQGAEQGH